MFRVEIGKALRRWRTWLLAAALAGVPVLIVIAVKASPPEPQAAEDAPPFLLQIVRNGLFAPLTGLAVVQPFFMSLAIGLFAGDAIAGEAQAGTLRYLLVRPIGRAKLLGAKYLVGHVAHGRAAPRRDRVGPGRRRCGVRLRAAPDVQRHHALHDRGARARRGLGAVHPAGGVGHHGGGFVDLHAHRLRSWAIVATVIVAIASQVIDQIPNLHALHPFVPTHGWLGFTGLFRFPVDWSGMRSGLTVSAAYTAAFLVLAVWNFRRRDVTS